MSTQLHIANSLVESRAFAAKDQAMLRDLAIARAEERRARRTKRRNAR